MSSRFVYKTSPRPHQSRQLLKCPTMPLKNLFLCRQWCPFNINFGNKRRSQGIRSGEWGWHQIFGTSLFLRKRPILLKIDCLALKQFQPKNTEILGDQITTRQLNKTSKFGSNFTMFDYFLTGPCIYLFYSNNRLMVFILRSSFSLVLPPKRVTTCILLNNFSH